MDLTHPSNNYRRYYRIAGITIQVEAELPITDTTFQPKFRLFEVDEPGDDTILIRHRFSRPAATITAGADEIYRTPPWVIYKKNNSWIYMSYPMHKPGIHTGLWYQIKQHLSCFSTGRELIAKPPKNNCQNLMLNRNTALLTESNHDHTRVNIYHNSKRFFRKGNFHSLSLLPTDQILFARVLAERQGCYLHASGAVLDGNGFLFVGHSDAGKSTIVELLKNKAKILCDDRMIVRKWNDAFRIHGSWSHGDMPEISADSAPLKAIFFLKQDRENMITHISRKPESVKRLLACLVKPLVTADWWDKMLTLVSSMVHEVSCYSLHFDKSGKIVDILKRI